jgi:hypothetical protein
LSGLTVHDSFRPLAASSVSVVAATDKPTPTTLLPGVKDADGVVVSVSELVNDTDGVSDADDDEDADSDSVADGDRV